MLAFGETGLKDETISSLVCVDTDHEAIFGKSTLDS